MNLAAPNGVRGLSRERVDTMTNLSGRPLRVFLSHSSRDKPAVRDLYQRLAAEEWIAPWLDEVDLLPGQDWVFEIQKAVREADVVLVCLSRGSISGAGFVQKELRLALVARQGSNAVWTTSVPRA